MRAEWGGKSVGYGEVCGGWRVGGRRGEATAAASLSLRVSPSPPPPPLDTSVSTCRPAPGGREGASLPGGESGLPPSARRRASCPLGVGASPLPPRPTAVHPAHKPVKWTGDRVRAVGRGAGDVARQCGAARGGTSHVSPRGCGRDAPSPPSAARVPSLPPPTRTPPPNRTACSRHRQPVAGGGSGVRGGRRTEGRREGPFLYSWSRSPSNTRPPYTASRACEPPHAQRTCRGGSARRGRPQVAPKRQGGRFVGRKRRGGERPFAACGGAAASSSAVWWPLAPRITAAAAHVGAWRSAATLDPDRGASAWAGGSQHRARRRGACARNATPPHRRPLSTPQSRAFGGPTQAPHLPAPPHTHRVKSDSELVRLGAGRRGPSSPLDARGSPPAENGDGPLMAGKAEGGEVSERGRKRKEECAASLHCKRRNEKRQVVVGERGKPKQGSHLPAPLRPSARPVLRLAASLPVPSARLIFLSFVGVFVFNHRKTKSKK